MSLVSRWKNWAGLPSNVRWMLVEAVCTLAVTRVLVAVGLRWCARWMLQAPAQQAVEAPPQELVRELRFVLFVATRHVPWRSVCLPTAMAGKFMLQRRGWPSVIHLGVGRQAGGDLHAHAWLEVEGQVISGADGIAAVVPLPAASLPRG